LTPSHDPVPDAVPRLLFVTGRLAEFALRGVLQDLTKQGICRAEVAVLPISVAALMTPGWVARHLDVPAGIDRIILPGFCRGDLSPVKEKAGPVPVELGPTDLRALPRVFGVGRDAGREGYGGYDIEILAEINHAPRLDIDQLTVEADRFGREGADWIDLGCDPAMVWDNVGDAVKRVRDRGLRVSIDTFNPDEVSAAVRAGAELVLSVNSSNARRAIDWGVEVVAIPDNPGSLDGLDTTLDILAGGGVPYRIDPILEPIGFGFASSLGRYLEALTTPASRTTGLAVRFAAAQPGIKQPSTRMTKAGRHGEVKFNLPDRRRGARTIRAVGNPDPMPSLPIGKSSDAASVNSSDCNGRDGKPHWAGSRRACFNSKALH